MLPLRYKQTSKAELNWQDGQPQSVLYGDPYSSIANGLEETEYVFIKHNGLPERWKNKTDFVIAETGFGTGRNFLVTCQHWLATTQSPQKLTFISVEMHPLAKADLQQALAKWPGLKNLSQELTEVYPVNISGFHRMELFDGRVSLLLLIGDATEMYQQLIAKVDAWFLDGFSPAKNKDMWSPSLFSQISRLSKQGSTFSTYAAAGDVRRSLQAVGFDVNRSPGFGKKREMIYGVISKPSISRISRPWFNTSKALSDNKKEICIIGAGIAGLTTAYVFSKRGWKVTVVDKHSNVASGASGNPVGLIMPRFTSDMNHGARFYTESFFNTVRWLNLLQKQTDFKHWHQSGVLHLIPESKLSKLRKLNFPKDFVTELNIEEIHTNYKIKASSGGLLIHQAGYVEPVKLCQFLYKILKDKVDFQFLTEVNELVKVEDKWQLKCDDGIIINSENVVVANANDVSHFFSEDHIAIIPVRGQVSQISKAQLKFNLDLPIVCENYITPEVNGEVILGASYDREKLTTELRDSEHLEIVSQMKNVLGDLFRDERLTKGRVSNRCTTHDRFPIIGPVPDWQYYRNSYVELKHGKPVENFPDAQYQSGLFLNTGHGSRGLVSSYNAAELLFSMISGLPLCFENEIIESMHPARFMIKKLKRGR